MIWKIPERGPTANVGHTLFRPTADNILLSASADYTVKIWDISTGQQRSELANVYADLIQGLPFNYNGTLVATTCKDKKFRIFDVRTGAIVNEINGHQGIKGSRVEWLGSHDKFVTTGFSRSSERQLFVWGHANLESGEPLKNETVDNASGFLIPKYDNDTNMLYVTGMLSEYKSQGFTPSVSAAALVTTRTAEISSPSRPSSFDSRAPVISEKELHDTLNSLRRENNELKLQVNSKDARIRQLKAKLEQLKAFS
ncbi:Coronin-like protein crn1 [Physocladia obscura]|uniref:Coronin-like protein crn1 n=1 Tax=Physocladia obscura TaxID=109957 RepID=A0AAD5X9I4_9FUNG|nr:Coronin-like protein crn1 [Physocladia obscura]